LKKERNEVSTKAGEDDGTRLYVVFRGSCADRAVRSDLVNCDCVVLPYESLHYV